MCGLRRGAGAIAEGVRIGCKSIVPCGGATAKQEEQCKFRRRHWQGVGVLDDQFCNSNLCGGRANLVLQACPNPPLLHTRELPSVGQTREGVHPPCLAGLARLSAPLPLADKLEKAGHGPFAVNRLAVLVALSIWAAWLEPGLL